METAKDVAFLLLWLAVCGLLAYLGSRLGADIYAAGHCARR